MAKAEIKVIPVNNRETTGILTFHNRRTAKRKQTAHGGFFFALDALLKKRIILAMSRHEIASVFPLIWCVFFHFIHICKPQRGKTLKTKIHEK